MSSEFLYLYHEKQVAGLCAVHALNTLMQDALFGPVDLMQIAQEFDRKEREEMMKGGVDSTDFLKYMAEDSGNVADDGNYSVQVVQVALQVWNLTCFPITSPDMKEAKANPLREEAFICNLASHWLTIRKIGNDWYNFNSMLDQPQYLSDFYLSAFLDTLLDKGWDIFVVRGDLPKYNPLKFSSSNSNWKKVRAKKPQGSQVSSYDADLEAAIAASLGGVSDADDSELAAALAMSVDTTPSEAGNAASPPPLIEPMDSELELAIQMSLGGANTTTTTTTAPTPTLPQEPPEPGSEVEPSQTTTLAIRLLDGSRLTRKFYRKDTIQMVHDFVTVKTNGLQGFTLASSFPTKRFEEMSQTLEQLGLVPDASLVVTKD